MKYYFAKNEREDALVSFIDELYILKCEQLNELSSSPDSRYSIYEIEDGLSQMHNRIIELLKELDENVSLRKVIECFQP